MEQVALLSQKMLRTITISDNTITAKLQVEESKRIIRCRLGSIVNEDFIVSSSRRIAITHHYDMTRGLSYHDGHTLADSCARSARRRKFSRWYSKIAAPPFPESSFHALSYSFIINNVILRCIPPLVHTRHALFRRPPIVESSHCGARVGHTWLHRVYTVPTTAPPPCVSTRRVYSTPR